jgi:hypothetical protein
MAIKDPRAHGMCHGVLTIISEAVSLAKFELKLHTSQQQQQQHTQKKSNRRYCAGQIFFIRYVEGSE